VVKLSKCQRQKLIERMAYGPSFDQDVVERAHKSGFHERVVMAELMARTSLNSTAMALAAALFVLSDGEEKLDSEEASELLKPEMKRLAESRGVVGS
jgi:hypothetical protein